MRPVFLMLFCAALAGCAPLSIYHKPGVSVTRMQSDQTNCEVAALRDAPVATQIRQRPPVFVPPRKICDAAGTCYTEPGYWVQGEIYTVDVNADLRGRVQTQCMAQKGYQPVSIPLCSASLARAAPPGQTTTLPRLTEQSCAIRNRDGTWQIVSQG